MDEEIDRAARRIGEGLRMQKRLSINDLCALLGGRQEILARTLAWLLVRDMISFGREKGTLYVMLQDIAQENAADVVQQERVPVTIL